MNTYNQNKILLYFLFLIFTIQFISCKTTAPTEGNIQQQNLRVTLNSIIPKPVYVNPTSGMFTLSESTKIYIAPVNSEISFIGQYFADKLKSSTGRDVSVIAATEIPEDGNIYLTTNGGNPTFGEEGYELIITENLVTLTAFKPAGLFRGIQTLRQLLSPLTESSTIQSKQWYIPACTIKDFPRFSWRGIMLDVARHFFKVDDVKKLIDLSAYYKINKFHIHLTDDQGWRIRINSWPNLAIFGGSTQVGGASGGYYTQQEYSEIVEYAKDRYITVIPEIDMPGHTNAALASYPVLNCDGVSPSLYTGIEVGFSSICSHKDSTYIFINDVVREIASLTPGPYIHIGGDEASATNLTDYINFIERVQEIVQSNGKQMIGWDEISQGQLKSNSVVQHWVNDSMAYNAVRQGSRLIMSPAAKTYMDMKYNSSTLLGQNWAGYIEVSDAYNWDPLTLLNGLTESDILGVEAPLWTETVSNLNDIEFMFFPRLPGIAEIGWSPLTGRNWEEYKERLAEHSPRWKEMGLNFYRSPEVIWK
jgi:hexosaminidase